MKVTSSLNVAVPVCWRLESIVVIPVILTVPSTVNFEDAVVVPIPTLLRDPVVLIPVVFCTKYPVPPPAPEFIVTIPVGPPVRVIFDPATIEVTIPASKVLSLFPPPQSNSHK